MLTISVIGLGYVGVVCAACQASEGHSVIGVDTDKKKLKIINEGRAPIIEKGLDSLINTAVKETGNLTTTSDITSATLNSDISFICVGTPSDKQGGLDLTYIEQVCSSLGKALTQKSKYHLIVLRSTVLPGTLLNFVKPILEKTSGLSAGKDFGLATNPEFLREGSAIADYRNPPMSVIGAIDDRAAAPLEELYKHLSCEIVNLPIDAAELVKYSCNAWHATKVAFSNEIGSLAKAFGIDGRKVMETVCKDRILNISDCYMKPGFAFGGSCLPKDVRALDHKARTHHIQLPLLHAVLESNRKHIYKAFSEIQKLGKNRIGLLGLSFKSGTDDLRESPLVELASILTGKGYDLQIYDPNLNESLAANGKNHDFARSIPYPYLLRLLGDDIQEVIEFADLIIVGNSEAEFRHIIDTLPEDKILLDLVGLMTTKSQKNHHGICW
jgi:GDP-mannose 6-dehydrogenase